MEKLLDQIAYCVEYGKINLSSPYPPNMKGEPGADELTKQALEKGISAQDILTNGLIIGMEKIGVKFKNNEVFVPQVLMSAKAMVYPTTFLESSCIAAIEAQAAGVPVVSTKLAALPETIIDGKTGWLIDGNPASEQSQRQFIDRTVMLLNDKNTWTQMSTQCSERAQSHYGWRQIADEWLNALFTDK